jgi:hypothetical protein
MRGKGKATETETEAELRALKRDLAKVLDITSKSNMVRGGLGNRQAIESYRNVTVASFLRNLARLGLVGASKGEPATRFLARTSLTADLAVLYAVPPRTLAEARARDDLRILISDPAASRLLSSQGEVGERWRETIANLALRSGVDWSTWELVRRSMETTDQHH